MKIGRCSAGVSAKTRLPGSSIHLLREDYPHPLSFRHFSQRASAAILADSLRCFAVDLTTGPVLASPLIEWPSKSRFRDHRLRTALFRTSRSIFEPRGGDVVSAFLLFLPELLNHRTWLNVNVNIPPRFEVRSGAHFLGCCSPHEQHIAGITILKHIPAIACLRTIWAEACTVGSARSADTT